MKKNPFLYKGISFKKKLLIMISALLLAIIIVISFSGYNLYSKNFTQQTINQTQQIIDQVALNVDTYLDELFRLTMSPYYNDDIMQELEDEYITSGSSLERKRNIENFLSSVMILPRSEILRVYILTGNNLYAYTRTPYDMNDYDSYKETDWYNEALISASPVFVPIHSEKVYGETPTQIFSIARRIRSKEDNAKVLAVIKVDANYSGIKSICDQVSLKENGSLFIVDQNKNVVYSNNNALSATLLSEIDLASFTSDGNYTQTIDSQDYILNTASLKTTDLTVIAVNSYLDLTKTNRSIRNMTILLASLCLVIAVVILFFMIQEFLKPLFSIITLMKQVQDGDLKVRVAIKNHDEIGYLASSFNRMIQRITEILDRNTQLVKEVYESRYLQKEAQYNILCSQIKPHFLYNTLNTISLLIKCKSYEQAIFSIEKFSYFLRGIINADKNILLSTELSIVDSYLGIQKARYDDHLTYEIAVDPAFHDYSIPALTLQPIVENAIIHGCEVKRGGSKIKLYSTKDDHTFSLHVTDNGAGINEEVLDRLNRELALGALTDTANESALTPSTTLSESIGLINVNKRIKLKFGEAYGLSIQSGVQKGTHVTLLLPLLPVGSAVGNDSDAAIIDIQREGLHVQDTDC